MENRHEPALMMLRGIVNEALMPGRLTIWCFDAPGGNDKRRAILPGYKSRPPTPGQVHINLGLMRELLSYTPAWQVRLDGFEGDDVVAAVVNHFRGQAPIEIITRDGDLTALCGPGVTCKAKCPVTPDLVPLYKLAVGDKSDTIPGIRGFGPGDWEKCDKERLAAVLADPWSSEEAQVLAGLRPPHRLWLKDNWPMVAAMRQVIAPMSLTPEEFNSALTVGTDNPTARELVMRKYLL